MKNQRVVLGLVSETDKAFINQSKLCLYSFRKNAGLLKNIPIVFITNKKPLSAEDEYFFTRNFSPISFIVKKDIIKHPAPAAKLNIFSTLNPDLYDIMIFLDCDTVVLKPLDDMLSPIVSGDYEFICRRGGSSDISCIKNLDQTTNFLNIADSRCFVEFEGVLERPIFNSGVFAFKSTVAKTIGDEAKSILPLIMTRKHIVNLWMGEQCALALSCIKNNIKVTYLDEVYNSWGNLKDVKILHCFKSGYKFDRKKMFKNFDKWKIDYETSDVPGKRMLVDLVERYREELG